MKPNTHITDEINSFIIENKALKKTGRFVTLRFYVVIGVLSVVVVTAALVYLLIVILQKTRVFDSSYALITATALMALVACLPIATLLTMLVTNLFLRPMDDMIISMSRAASGAFTDKVSTERCHGDMKKFVDSYNNMLGELSGIEMFREDFINNFSHEFKTPIVSIRGFAEQLQRDDLTPEQRQEYAKLIASESEKLTNMSANVLLLTKYETQGVVVGKEWFSLDEQLRECLFKFQNDWERKDFQLEIALEPVTYYGDPKMLEHIWVNLISNAIKFTADGGELGIGCRQVGSVVEVTVSDSGIGMSTETLKHVFEKFYQGDRAHTSAGNGLGLSIVKRVVQLNGGRVSVESIPGIGSTFTVMLPVTKQPPQRLGDTF